MSQKIFFRLHRGGYDESMQTVKEFDTFPALIAYLRNEFHCRHYSLITFTYYGYDSRNHWHTLLFCYDGSPIGEVGFVYE